MDQQIIHYLDSAGKDVYQFWLDGLRDRISKIAIIRRIARLQLGNFVNRASLRDGVCELRIDVGPGSRVYYAHAGSKLILLMAGGNKSTQSRDITRAILNFQDWKMRREEIA